MAQQSHACCTVPPVVAKDYDVKGKYITIDGMKTYHTGPASAKRAIFFIFDIFGFFPQTLQGADILAHSDKEKPYQVFMCDFFDGKPADVSWYPPQTDEHKQKLAEFFSTAAAPPKTVEKATRAIKEIESSVQKFDSWGVVGYCWGAKIVNMMSQQGTSFKAAACCHPAMVDPADAEKVAIPIAILPSKDEDAKAIDEYKSKLSVPNVVEPFPTQVHGWMAARADLEDDEVRKEYERGYKVLLDFFHEHL